MLSINITVGLFNCVHFIDAVYYQNRVKMVVTQCKLPQKLWRYLVFVNMFIIMVAYRNAIIKMHVITADKLQELIEEFSNRCSFVLNI